MSEDYFKKLFAKKLNYYMNITDKKQIDLINDLGVTRSAVSTWCNGTRLPTMDKIDMLSKYFNVKRSDLLEEKESEIETLAAHHDGEWTEEELQSIEDFKEFIKNKRKK